MPVNKNFSNQRLVLKNMRGESFLDCLFRNANLYGADLSGCNLFGSDFTGAKLTDVAISLNCKTFFNVTYDDVQIFSFLYLLTLSNCNVLIKSQLQNIIGEERYKLLAKKFGPQ